MPLHLMKLCVGAASVDDQARWVEKRVAQNKQRGLGAVHDCVTRMRPRRDVELLDGGSIYWSIKGNLLTRQKIIEIGSERGADGVLRAKILLEPALILTCAQPRRAFQGWRYLSAEEAPADAPVHGGAPADPALSAALADLGLLQRGAMAMKHLIIGAGAAAAAGVGAVSFWTPSEDAAPDPVTVRMEEQVCLKADIEFLPGDQARCLSRAEIMKWRSEPLRNGDSDALTVMMSHPTDATQAPSECKTCSDYIKHRFEGWYAMSSRDMRREAFFVRACGVIELLLSSGAAEHNYFDGAGLNAASIEEIGVERLLAFGEPASAAADPEIEKLTDTAWRIAADGQMVFVNEVAALDFDADNVAEILAFFLTGPSDGTARIPEIALIEKDGADAPLSLTPVDFTKDAIGAAGG